MASEPDTIDDAADSPAGDAAPEAPAEPPKKRPPLRPPPRRKPQDALGPWEPVVRFGYVALVAVLVALVAMRVNRPRQAELSGVEPGIDPLLMQPVKTTEVNMTSIRWAVEGLNKA